MKTRATEEKNRHDTRSTSENRGKDRVGSPNYIAVLAILNTIVQRVSASLPAIQEATRMLPDRAAILDMANEGRVSR